MSDRAWCRRSPIVEAMCMTSFLRVSPAPHLEALSCSLRRRENVTDGEVKRWRPCRDSIGMPDVTFGNLLIIAAVAVCAPLFAGAVPRLRVPAVVLEIVAGIVLGPTGFDVVHIDLPVQILALFGLAFLLFLAGLEIDLAALRG